MKYKNEYSYFYWWNHDGIYHWNYSFKDPNVNWIKVK